MSEPIFESLSMGFPLSIDLTLGRVSRLLKALGTPQRYMPPVIHVAGTNGKGSIIAFLRSILEEAGYNVHVYTSPHLIRYNERVRVSGKLLSDYELELLIQDCIRINKERSITFFEIMTAAAFLAFSRSSADLTLIETGLGGRLDATNLIENPAVSVITPISIDHEQHLGKGIRRIATEKAGILKTGCPVVVAKQRSTGLSVIEASARKKGVPLWRYGVEWQVRHMSFGSVFDSFATRRILPVPHMLGMHQRDNAATATAALDLLEGFPVSNRDVWLGILSTKWPGRFQLLGVGPLTNLVDDRVRIWVDGGHNGAGGEVLANLIKVNLRNNSVGLIIGMLATKSPEDFIKPLAPHVQNICAIGFDKAVAFDKMELAQRLLAVGIYSKTEDSLSSAIQYLSKEGCKNVIICGSLHLAGQALSQNDELLT